MDFDGGEPINGAPVDFTHGEIYYGNMTNENGWNSFSHLGAAPAVAIGCCIVMRPVPYYGPQMDWWNW